MSLTSFTARTCLLVLGAATFLLNPLACVPAEHDDGYQYGDRELRAAVEGTWRVSISPMEGASTSFTVELRQASGTPTTAAVRQPSLIRSARACGARTLVRSAAACADYTQMPLTVQVREGDEAIRGAKANGQFSVYSLIFTQGQLELTVGAHTVLAQISKDGGVLSANASAPRAASVTMVRLAP